MAKGKKAQLQTKMKTNVKQLRESKVEKMARNPFEVRKNKRLHHNIAGRNVKGRTRNMVISQNKALTQRQNELENQYAHENKMNIFQDRRFGENDSSMSNEDRMLKRLQAERKKQLKKNRFALEDNEEDILTHRGEELNFEQEWKNAMGDYENDEDDSDGIDMETEMQKYYEQMKEYDKTDTNPENRQKTHKEIMMEIINKSKEYKALRQKQKAKIDDEIDRLDSNMSELQGLLSFRNKNEKSNEEDNKYSDFDRLTHELQTELRGSATERKKTEEEIMKEEREKLEKLEQERIKRMQGAYVDENNKIIEGGDDLDENFKLEEDIQEEESEDELMEDENEEEDPHLNALEEEEMYGDEDMEKATHEEELNDEDLLQSEEETEELSNTEVLEILKQKKLQETKYEQARAEQQQRREKEAEIKRIRKLNMKKAEEEMPYILPIPENVAAFMELLMTYHGQEKELVHRIRVSNNIFTKKENRGHLMNFYQMLLRAYEQYYNSIVLPASYLNELDLQMITEEDHYEVTEEEVKVYIHGVQQLEEAIVEMSEDKHIIDGIDRIWRQKLQEIQKIISQCILSKSGYPDLSVLMDLYLCFYIYPVTDFNHPMITPAVHLLGQMLNSCCIVDPQSCLMALLAVSIALEYMQRANRYIPEAIAALYSISDYLLAGQTNHLHLFINDHCEWITDSTLSVHNEKIAPFIQSKLPFFFLTNSLSPSIEYRDLILCQLFSTIQKGLEIYSQFNIVIELAKPFLTLFDAFRKQIPSSTFTVDYNQQYIEPIAQYIIQQHDNRKPFSLYSKIVENKTFTPKHNENYQPGQSLHPNREFIEIQQLQKQKKSEKKAVEREIRKDALYVDMLKERERNEMEEQRERKLHEVMGWLEDQERTINQAVKKGLAKGGGAKLGSNLKK